MTLSGGPARYTRGSIALCHQEAGRGEITYCATSSDASGQVARLAAWVPRLSVVEVPEVRGAMRRSVVRFGAPVVRSGGDASAASEP